VFKKNKLQQNFSKATRFEELISLILTGARRGLINVKKLLYKVIFSFFLNGRNIDKEQVFRWIHSSRVFGGAGFGNGTYGYKMKLSQKVRRKKNVKISFEGTGNIFPLEYIEMRYENRIPNPNMKYYIYFHENKVMRFDNVGKGKYIAEGGYLPPKLEWDVSDTVVEPKAFSNKVKLSLLLRKVSRNEIDPKQIKTDLLPSSYLRSFKDGFYKYYLIHKHIQNFRLDFSDCIYHGITYGYLKSYCRRLYLILITSLVMKSIKVMKDVLFYVRFVAYTRIGAMLKDTVYAY
jgi:hypothetical protein